jgi:hypothetical protein
VGQHGNHRPSGRLGVRAGFQQIAPDQGTSDAVELLVADRGGVFPGPSAETILVGLGLAPVELQ